jgi:6,7-dimethyl-8-ribityllumazine synthase
VQRNVRNTRSRPRRASGLRIAVVASRFNEDVTARLVSGAQEQLRSLGIVVGEVTWVPGAFELPLAALTIIRAGKCDAVVCLGAVIRGETPHFEYVAGACAYGIQDVMMQTGVPVAFGVLTTNTLQQALDRSGGKHGNKGRDAALTAVDMASRVGARRKRSG